MTNTKQATALGILALAALATTACQPSNAAPAPHAKGNAKADAPAPIKTTHRPTTILDQGDVNACGGFAMAAALGKGERDAMKLYKLATEIDGFDGAYPAQDTGTSVQDVARAAKRLKMIRAYTVIDTSRAALKALPKHRVIVTLNWVEKGGPHIMVLIGKNGKNLVFQNSWGKAGGNRGLAVIPQEQFNREFVAAVTVAE